METNEQPPQSTITKLTLYDAELRSEYDRLKRLWDFWQNEAENGLQVNCVLSD